MGGLWNFTGAQVTNVLFYLRIIQYELLSVEVVGTKVKCVDPLTDLCVIMENTFSFDRHISKKCQIACILLRNLGDIRKHLTHKAKSLLSHSLSLRFL